MLIDKSQGVEIVVKRVNSKLYQNIKIKGHFKQMYKKCIFKNACILVPKSNEMELSALESMVQEVNATQVAPNEILSDHVYAYDSETKEIYRADKEAEHLKAKEAMKEEKGEEKNSIRREAQKHVLKSGE